MLQECPTCEKEFENNNLSRKYCSEECRLENVRENDRIRKKKKRDEQRAIREKEQEHLQLVKKEERKQSEQQIREDRKSELMARVNAGDPLARKQVAKPFSIEYWEAYQEYEIDNAERWDRQSTRTVNGVSVYEPDFPEKVIMTIEELGHIGTNKS